jgi:hypothetical protein
VSVIIVSDEQIAAFNTRSVIKKDFIKGAEFVAIDSAGRRFIGTYNASSYICDGRTRLACRRTEKKWTKLSVNVADCRLIIR